MSEFIRIPYYILPESCNYGNGLAEGYLLGLITVFIVYSLIEIIETINIPCNKVKSESESESESESGEKSKQD